MAAAKKGKKRGTPKKGTKGKKKNKNTGFFTKFFLVLLVLSMIVAAVFFTFKNFNANIASFKKEGNEKKTEVVVTKEETKKHFKPEEKDNTEVTIPQKKDEAQKATDSKKEHKELKTLTGCWLSSEQGAFITIDEYGYRIDFSNVDASKPLTGNYYINDNLITFTSDGNECEDDGIYRITFYKKNMSLSCKNDDCTDRRNILEADWEWIEY